MGIPKRSVIRARVDELIPIADELFNEHKKQPNVINYPGDAEDINKRLQEGPTETEKKMRKFLEGLSEEEVRAVEAVMYGGRGDDLPTIEKAYSYLEQWNKKDVIRTIMEKTMRLPDYLRKGIERYQL